MIKKATLLLVFVFAPLLVDAQTINITAPSTADIRESFDVQVNLETCEDVYATQFDLLFNPNILEAVKISYTHNNSTYTTYFLNNTYGKVKFGVTCIGNCILSRDLANITFKSLSLGKNIFHLQNIKVLNLDIKEINISTSSKEIIIIKTTDTFNKKTDIHLNTSDSSKPYDKNALNTSIKTKDDVEKSDNLVNTSNEGNNKTNNDNSLNTNTKTNEYNNSVSGSEHTKSANAPIETGNRQYSIILWIILIGIIILILITLKMMKK